MGRPHIMHELHLPVGIAAGSGDYQCADPLRPVMGAKAAGEKPISIGNLHHAGLIGAYGGQRPGHALLPYVQILTGISHNNRIPRGARSGVNANHIRLIRSKIPLRIMIPQILFCIKGQ